MRRGVILAAVLALVTPAGADALEPRRGALQLEFDAAFGLELVTKGVNAIPVAPATQDSLVVTLPVRPGGYVRDARDARVRTRGGLDLHDPGDDVRITQTKLVATIEGRRLELTAFALIDGIGYDRFAFAYGRIGRAKLTAGAFKVRDVVLRLNGVAVAALNSQLATTAFEEDQRIGTARLDVSGARSARGA